MVGQHEIVFVLDCFFEHGGGQVDGQRNRLALSLLIAGQQLDVVPLLC